jgi:hypothetical protein
MAEQMEAGGARGMRWGNYKGFVRNADEFSHKYACWAYNHRGWAKMKKANRKLAKKRLKRAMEKDAEE